MQRLAAAASSAYFSDNKGNAEVMNNAVRASSCSQLENLRRLLLGDFLLLEDFILGLLDGLEAAGIKGQGGMGRPGS